MLTSRWLLIFTMLASAGCQVEAERRSSTTYDASHYRLTGKNAVANRSDVYPAPPSMEKVDPIPIAKSSRSMVLQSDVQVDGKPACDFVIRYPDAIDQKVTWNNDPCKSIRARFIAVAHLQQAGQLNDISDEARLDIQRLPGKQVFYIESKFTASVYPLNVAGLVYEVSLSD
jgi:hypothetical protein